MSRNSEAVKRWRNAHRALYNLRRREYWRKKNGNVGREIKPLREVLPIEAGLVANQTERDRRRGTDPEPRIYDKEETLRALRELVARDEDEDRVRGVEVADEVRKYRDDFGRLISEREFRVLQRAKARALLEGYEIDEFSQ